jgi:hypothetical protein
VSAGPATGQKFEAHTQRQEVRHWCRECRVRG